MCGGGQNVSGDLMVVRTTQYIQIHPLLLRRWIMFIWLCGRVCIRRSGLLNDFAANQWEIQCAIKVNPAVCARRTWNEIPQWVPAHSVFNNNNNNKIQNDNFEQAAAVIMIIAAPHRKQCKNAHPQCKYLQLHAHICYALMCAHILI